MMREHAVYNVVTTNDKVGSISVVIASPTPLLNGLSGELDDVTRLEPWSVGPRLKVVHRML
jgi:hypothetical protein